MIDPSRVQFAPLCIQDQAGGREETLYSCGGGRRSQIPRRIVICKYLKVYMSHLLANATRALPAGPLATSEGSIFCHQAKHSTSCSSESRTLSTTPKIQKHGTELSTICQIHLQSRFFSPGLGREPRVTFGCLHSGTKQVATNPTMLKYFQ